jgi:hopanoid biosynthesis associated RND transporter like protein HpnN
MVETLIVRLVRACCHYPGLTVFVALLMTLGAGIYTYENFAIHTDTSQLISSRLPWRQREMQLDTAFPQLVDTIIVVLDGDTPEMVRDGSSRLAARLAEDRASFEAVQEAEGGAFFKKNGLLFLSPDEVQLTTEQLIRAQPFLGTLTADPSLHGLAEALALIPKGVEAGSIELKNFDAPLTVLSSTIDTLLQGRPAAFSWTELMTGKVPAKSELRRFIRVKPRLDFEALQPGAKASEKIRNAAVALGLTPDKGVSVRLTGPVAMADEEFGTLAEGALLNILITASAVLLILWLALRSKWVVLAVLISLFVGFTITAALGLALVGALNPISMAFAVLFVGIGVDFGIQVAVRYRRERHLNNHLEQALDTAVHAIAKPLTLAAAATAAGFYSFFPTAYRGVSELGLIAGNGMLVAFLTSVTVLPALLTLWRPPPEPDAIGYRRLAPMDRFMARHRVLILVLAGVAVIAGLPLFRNLSFDFNPLNLRSAKVESVATLLELMQDPATTPTAIEVLAPSLGEADALAQRLYKLSEVSSTITLKSFVPDKQDEKLVIIADAADLLGPSLDALEADPAPSDFETESALDEAANAFRALPDQPAESASRKIARSLEALAEADPAGRADVANTLLRGLKLQLDEIRASLHPEHIVLSDLPEDLRRDWIAADGRARIEVRPKGNQNDNVAMRRFAAAVLAVAPQATGMPILVQESADTIVHAFFRAATFALLSITVILFLALRRVRDVLVTLVPLLLAGVVTLELTVLFGLPLNFANIIALPLLLGVGVAFKIYYVLAWREGETSLLASSLTRAVLFSAMTTATAFASLWLSHHPGTSSMGKLLSLSLITTLAAAVLFQPILMGPPRQEREPNRMPPGGRVAAAPVGRNKVKGVRRRRLGG